MRKIVGIAVLVFVSALLAGQVPEPEHVTVQNIQPVRLAHHQTAQVG
jgi:hypothetical protein